MKQKVSFGLIGAGGISQSQHLPNLTQSDLVHLKVVCDLGEDRLKLAQEQYQVPQVTTDYREVLADPEIDAVLIATKPESHAAITIEALQAGKHVYVEKPLAEKSDECNRIVAAEKQSGKMAVVGFNRRMAPAYRLAKQVIETHGGPRNIHYRISDAYHIWGKGLPQGTRIIHEVCHIFDILRYLTGSEVTSVYCAASRPDDEAMLLQFQSGCIATVMSTGYVQYDMPKESLEVIVDLGGFIVSDFVELRTFGLNDFDPCYRFEGHTHPHRDQAHRKLFNSYGQDAMVALRRFLGSQISHLHECKTRNPNSPETLQMESYLNNHVQSVNYMMDKGWRHAIEHFALCILENRRPELARSEDGLRATLITEAAIESRDTGQIIMLRQ